jgi:hypothetical protein
MIRVDATSESIVIACTRCHWRSMADDRATAWRAGIRHELAVHPADRPGIHAAYAGWTRATRKPPRT